MGMFDEIRFKCQKSGCGADITVQTKGGKCEGKTYHARSVPPDAAAYVADQMVTCEKCETVHTIKVPARVEARLVLGSEDDPDNYD